jgi:Rrf2 family protein
VVENARVRISAKADYAVRAMIELAGASEDEPLQPELIQAAQDIPQNFLASILNDLGHHNLVNARRGRGGGYWLGRPPDEIALGEVIAAVDGPLATVHGQSPAELDYRGAARPLERVWTALEDGVRGLLESVTLADVVSGDVPTHAPRSTPASRSPTG